MTVGKTYDQAYIKRHNIQRVLNVLEDCHSLSRTELAHITEMSATSITRIVGALISLGLVKEVAIASSAGRGRKAIMLEKCPDGIYAAGFHLDTEVLQFCLIDFESRVHFTSARPVPSGTRTPEALARCAREMYRGAPAGLVSDWRRVRMLGVSVSGTVDYHTGVVTRSEQLGWQDVDLSGAFASEFNLPVRVENDVKSCLTGEKMRFNIPPEQDSAYLYIGRAGIGAASTANGRLIRGKDNASGEIEEIPLGGGDTLDRHLMNRYLMERALLSEPGVADVRDIVDAYRQKTGWARMLVSDFQRHMRLLLSMIDSLLNPHQIILGGETIHDFAPLLEGILSDRVFPGHDFYETCAYGVAIIAMQEAVQGMLTAEQG
jgi:predicted NBD/HSP70 family sugar kinase